MTSRRVFFVNGVEDSDQGKIFPIQLNEFVGQVNHFLSLSTTRAGYKRADSAWAVADRSYLYLSADQGMQISADQDLREYREDQRQERRSKRHRLLEPLERENFRPSPATEAMASAASAAAVAGLSAVSRQVREHASPVAPLSKGKAQQQVVGQARRLASTLAPSRSRPANSDIPSSSSSSSLSSLARSSSSSSLFQQQQRRQQQQQQSQLSSSASSAATAVHAAWNAELLGQAEAPSLLWSNSSSILSSSSVPFLRRYAVSIQLLRPRRPGAASSLPRSLVNNTQQQQSAKSSSSGSPAPMQQEKSAGASAAASNLSDLCLVQFSDRPGRCFAAIGPCCVETDVHFLSIIEPMFAPRLTVTVQGYVWRDGNFQVAVAAVHTQKSGGAAAPGSRLLVDVAYEPETTNHDRDSSKNLPVDIPDSVLSEYVQSIVPNVLLEPAPLLSSTSTSRAQSVLISTVHQYLAALRADRIF